MENLRFRGRLMVFEQTLGREPCWIYPGKPQSNGYCTVYVRYDDGSQHHILAHKLAYLFLRGSYPETSEIDGRVYPTELDHLCRTPRCCNPWHLEPVSQLENWWRGQSISALNARKTHCKNGHLLSGDNLIVKFDKKGRRQRVCRVCLNAWHRTDRAADPDRYRAYDALKQERARIVLICLHCGMVYKVPVNRRRDGPHPSLYCSETCDYASRLGRPGWQSQKTHCKRGHPFDDENTIVFIKPDGRQKRICRACNKARCLDYYSSKRVQR